MFGENEHILRFVIVFVKIVIDSSRGREKSNKGRKRSIETVREQQRPFESRRPKRSRRG